MPKQEFLSIKLIKALKHTPLLPNINGALCSRHQREMEVKKNRMSSVCLIMLVPNGFFCGDTIYTLCLSDLWQASWENMFLVHSNAKSTHFLFPDNKHVFSPWWMMHDLFIFLHEIFLHPRWHNFYTLRSFFVRTNIAERRYRTGLRGCCECIRNCLEPLTTNCFLSCTNSCS